MFDFFRNTKKAAALDGIAEMLANLDRTIAENRWLDDDGIGRMDRVTLKRIRGLVHIGKTL